MSIALSDLMRPLPRLFDRGARSPEGTGRDMAQAGSAMKVLLLAAMLAMSVACLESGRDYVGRYLRISQQDLESKLSVTLGEWQPWAAAPGYFLARDEEHTVSFYGYDWHLTAFRCDSVIDAITLEAPYPGYDEYRRLIEEIAYDERVQWDEDGIAWVQDAGNLVHFRSEPRGMMSLTVTDHHMSATYESTMMIEDLQFLDDATRRWNEGR